MSKNPITVKFILGDDIRRIPFSLAKEFQNLQDLLKKLYLLESVSYQIKYKDDEEDLITIGSTRDYEECIKCCNSDILKLIIVPLQNKEEIPHQRRRRCHNKTGFKWPAKIFQDILPCKSKRKIYLCDGCDEEIKGNALRFHCRNCIDFDFCDKCITTKISEHPEQHQFDLINPKEGVEKNNDRNQGEKHFDLDFRPILKEEKKIGKSKNLNDLQLKLEALSQLGFTDTERNLEILEQNNGELVPTIKKLVN